jgi:hypothetical protein
LNQLKLITADHVKYDDQSPTDLPIIAFRTLVQMKNMCKREIDRSIEVGGFIGRPKISLEFQPADWRTGVLFGSVLLSARTYRRAQLLTE